MAGLRVYQWPGNIRELENVIERSILLADDDVLDLEDLPPHVRGTEETGQASAMSPGQLPAAQAGATSSLKDVVKEHTRRIEKHVIQQTLTETGGNVTRAAELLQISQELC